MLACLPRQNLVHFCCANFCYSKFRLFRIPPPPLYDPPAMASCASLGALGVAPVWLSGSCFPQCCSAHCMWANNVHFVSSGRLAYHVPAFAGLQNRML